jgi:hypothetical protein
MTSFCPWMVKEGGQFNITGYIHESLISFLFLWHDGFKNLNFLWSSCFCRNGSFLRTDSEVDILKSSETERKSDALAVQRAFRSNSKVVMISYCLFCYCCSLTCHSLTHFICQGNSLSGPKEHSYSTQVIATSPNTEIESTEQPHLIPQLQCSPRPLPVRVAAMSKILVHCYIS